MKKLFVIGLLALSLSTAFAQNLQLHYDLGKGRSFVTSTVEMFRPDKHGNTFFFIDMDYGVGEVQGISLAYWELARVFTLPSAPVGWHIEYNGGMGQYYTPSGNGAYTIHNSWLTGLDYSVNSADFSKGFTLKTLYKYLENTPDNRPHSYQLTAVWYVNFANNKMTFSGFADLWRETTPTGKMIFLSEPQLWYNLNANFAVGGEVELSNHFAGMEGFQIMPTLGLKYTF